MFKEDSIKIVDELNGSLPRKQLFRVVCPQTQTNVNDCLLGRR